MFKNNGKTGHPGRCQIDLKHHTQDFNWDCGLSCVLMVMSDENREYFLENRERICKEEGFNTSTWTIDLCYLLKRFGVRHIFYTITLGVHPAYERIDFYNQIFNRDEERVNRRFDDAEKNGILISKGAISWRSILEHLTTGPVILLTNAKLLGCDICKYNKMGFEMKRMFRWPVPYQGHYIVLCGYNTMINKVFYRNPTLTDRICVMSIKDLDDARRSYGTDQDAIFIYPS
ncbi:protein GUCD1 isoform X2 [Coccinella septempunctata]|uniref:protein GUCD1 isoform X2 n=1 Tax=Coccinella septempunctata TaxID=41139 RepID=UPI001D0646E5|nr:protein GUCD1 isoform X2 [Coccinella septempunctata]